MHMCLQVRVHHPGHPASRSNSACTGHAVPTCAGMRPPCSCAMPWHLTMPIMPSACGQPCHAMSSAQGRYVTLLRHNGQLACIVSICFHAGGPLGVGDIEDVGGRPCLSCPWHYYKVGSAGAADAATGVSAHAQGQHNNSNVQRLAHQALLAQPPCACLLVLTARWTWCLVTNIFNQ